MIYHCPQGIAKNINKFRRKINRYPVINLVSTSYIKLNMKFPHETQIIFYVLELLLLLVFPFCKISVSVSSLIEIRIVKNCLDSLKAHKAHSVKCCFVMPQCVCMLALQHLYVTVLIEGAAGSPVRSFMSPPAPFHPAIFWAAHYHNHFCVQSCCYGVNLLNGPGVKWLNWWWEQQY